MTLSKTDRAALKAIAAALPTVSADDTLPYLRHIEQMADGGNAELDNLLSTAQFAIGDISQSDDDELEDNVDYALQAIAAVLDYRRPRDPKPRAAGTASKGVEFVTKPDGSMWCRL